jgi:predicted dehydrogenase
MPRMNTSPIPQSSRRDFLKTSGQLAAAGALVGVALPHVHAAGSDQINVALVGCGGRGTGAARDAMDQSGPPKLVAMADVSQTRLDTSYNTLIKRYKDQVDVPKDRQFIGFDAYKAAMDCLKKGDVAIFTTPLAFRWVHFKYAVEKGLNVFMEKPITADGPTSRRMLKLAEEATAKKLKVGVGLKSRHSRALQELHKRISDGEIGDLTMLRGYRMQGPIGSCFSTKWDGQGSELLWQISRFHGFLWASGGGYSDFNIHHIDHLCWMKNAWPVKAQGVGGRHYRNAPGGEPYVDQNFDSYSVEYTFEDGAKMFMDGRNMLGAVPIYSSYAHGTKGMAIVSNQGDCGRPSRTHRGQNPTSESLIWKSKENKDGSVDDPFHNEWADLIEAIRDDKPFNEAASGVNASVVTSMGRYAAHTGQEVTFEEFLNHEHEYAPGADKFTFDSPAPVQADKNGLYPVPEPGIKKNREY